MTIYDLLFYRKGVLRDSLEVRKRNLREEIEGYETNYILNASEDDLCQFLISKYSLEIPEIHEDKIHVYEPTDVDIDVSRDPRRVIFDRSRPSYVTGTKVTIVIPFDGDGDLFQYRPSSFTTNPPIGEIVKQEIHLIYQMTSHDPDELKRMYQRDLNVIEKYLGWVKSDAGNFNNQLESFVRQIVGQRKKKLLDDLSLVSVLHIPMKRRNDLLQTYAVPTIRKKPRIEQPKVTREGFKPEPALAQEEYENILETIFDMSLVMERSPQTFSKLKEEEIRNHFLIFLNAQYEGQATGETFNYKGKTDLLIRIEGRNVFIAECKFWSGEKGFLKTIDQLFRYISWRDTKTAILIFNKTRDFSSVLNKIDSEARSHSCYKREYNLKNTKLKNETTFGYVFHQPDDKNREIILTIMAFDVPHD